MEAMATAIQTLKQMIKLESIKKNPPTPRCLSKKKISSALVRNPVAITTTSNTIIIIISHKGMASRKQKKD